MSYQATVFNVMIASPSDITRERVIARDVIMEWNAINSVDREIALLPIGWDTHSSPSMTATAQEVINSQVLAEADLLIAIFWTRLGTETGAFASGTVEEIEKHIDSGREALIYLSSVPVELNSVDQDQYAALKDFLETLRSRGLLHKYSDLTQFRTDLSRHIAQTVKRKFSPGSVISEAMTHAFIPEQPPLSQSAQDLLFEAVLDQHGNILQLSSLGGFRIISRGRDFTANTTQRDRTRWQGAITELESLGMIVDTSGKRQVFSVTEKGYVYAESLGVTPES